MPALVLWAALAATPVPSPLPTPTPVTRPAPSPAPAVLPHYIRLGALEQAQVDRLTDELAEAARLVAAGRLASAWALARRARREADAAQRQLLVLDLAPDWRQARARLDALDQQLAAARAKGPDPESRALAATAARRLEPDLAALERDFAKLSADEVDRRLRALREALYKAGTDPLLVDNPAWQAPSLAIGRRLDALQQRQSLRAGQAVLVDEIARMIDLDASARAKLAHEDYDGALGDYAALEEACVAFKQDLAALQARGFNPATIRFEGSEGERRGRTFLSRVDRWLADARRREQLVAEARDPWRKGLTGDRLRVYGFYGTAPTWPGAPENPDVASALAQELWVFYELPPGDPHVRIRHEYHFAGDHLQHHEMFRERTP